MKYLAKKSKKLCDKVTVFVVAFVMIVAGVLGTGVTVNAGATNITLSNPEYYETGTLKKLTATFRWTTAEARGRLVLMKEKLSDGDFTNYGNYRDCFSNFEQVEAEDQANGTFGIVSCSEEKTYAGNSNEITFDFGETDIPLNRNALYYVYLWTFYLGDYYPDNLIMAINVANGQVQYTPATGLNSFDNSNFTTVVNAEQFDVTVTPASYMTRKEDSGDEVQENLNRPMTSVVYTANAGYYFPEDYTVAAANGINVSRDSETQITVYGKPTADTTITLSAPTRRTTALEDTTFSYAYDIQRSPAYPKKGDTITASGLQKPYTSNGREESAGSWTLTKIGTYSIIENSDKDSDSLRDIVTTVAGKYVNATKENIVVHELKKGNTHIAYGATLAYDSTSGLAVFLGDALPGSAGYLLSTQAKSGVLSINANLDVTDWVPPTTYQITVTNTENGTTTTSISRTIAGDKVTIHATPNTGYVVENVKYNDGTDDHVVSLANGKYTFVMPAKNVTVTVTYKYAHTHTKGTYHSAVEGNCVDKGTVAYYDCVNGCACKLDADGNVLTSIEGTLQANDHKVELKKMNGISATVESAGVKAHWTCESCAMNYADEAGKTLIGNAEALATWKMSVSGGKIEPIKEGILEGTNEKETADKHVTVKTTSVNTGDNSLMTVWIAILVTAFVVMMSMFVVNEKQKCYNK